MPAEVEVLPWFHFEDNLAHLELVDYFRNVKGVAVGLEITQDNLDYLTNYIANPKRMDDLNPRQREYLGGYAPALDVIFECLKRRIPIFPLETPESRELADRARGNFFSDAIETELRRTSAAIKRDEVFVRRISEIRNAIGPKKRLFAIVGAVHASNLNDELMKSGIPSRLALESFSEKRKIGAFLALSKSLYSAVRQNQLSSAKEFAKRVLKLNLGMHRRNRVSIIEQLASMALRAKPGPSAVLRAKAPIRRTRFRP